jgi:hypothetical protein
MAPVAQVGLQGDFLLVWCGQAKIQSMVAEVF